MPKLLFFIFSLMPYLMFCQNMKIHPVVGVDVTTKRSPFSNFASEKRVLGIPFVGVRVFPFKGRDIFFGYQINALYELFSNDLNQPALISDSLQELLWGQEINMHIPMHRKTYLETAIFQRKFENVTDHTIIGNRKADWGVALGISQMLENSIVTIRTKIFLNNFSALVNMENYEFRISSNIREKNSKASSKGFLFASSFKLGFKLMPTYNLISYSNERSPNLSWLPSFGYQIVHNKLNIGFFLEFDIFNRINFGSRSRNIQQIINSTYFGVKKYFFDHNTRVRHAIGLSYMYSRNSNLNRFSRSSKYQIKGMGIHYNYYINDNFVFDVQSMITLKSSAKSLTNINYSRIGFSYLFN